MVSRVVCVLAGLASLVLAQTPSGFSPGSLQRLGISYKRIEINPAGAQIQGLSQVAEAPQIRIPQAALTGPDGKLIPNRKFMIFMIDIDVVRNNISTTNLHWFQPDLMPQGDSLVLFGNPPAPGPSPSPQQPAPPASPPNAPGTPGSPPVAPPKLDLTTPSILLAVNETASQLRLRLHKRQQPIDPNDPPGLGPGTFGTRQQAPYFGPGPPPGPPHRYVQILFAQPDNFTIPSCFNNIITPPGVMDRRGRVGFDIDQFLQAASVRPRPIAGNYFRAQNPMPGPLEAKATATAVRNNSCGAPAPAAATAASMASVAASPSASAAVPASSSPSSSPSPPAATAPPAAPKMVKRLLGVPNVL